MIGARVYLWGTEIGAVTQEDASSLPRFQYTRAFQRSGIEPSPLMMPVTNRIYAFPANQNDAFLGLPGLLADSLPDKFGNRLIQAYLARIGRTMRELSAVERLCYTGSRGMGALEYVPAHEFISNTSESVQIDELVKLASDILSERKEWYINTNEHGLEQLMRIGTSAGGARAKALIAWNPVTGDIRSGQIDAGAGYEYWLIKFDGVENNRDKEDSADKPSYTRIEYAYYLMAQHARITMSRCRLHRDNGLYHFMTQRFDRANGGGKIHIRFRLHRLERHAELFTPELVEQDGHHRAVHAGKIEHFPVNIRRLRRLRSGGAVEHGGDFFAAVVLAHLNSFYEKATAEHFQLCRLGRMEVVVQNFCHISFSSNEWWSPPFRLYGGHCRRSTACAPAVNPPKCSCRFLLPEFSRYR